jgi:hypothetical protein
MMEKFHIARACWGCVWFAANNNRSGSDRLQVRAPVTAGIRDASSRKSKLMSELVKFI